MHKSFRLVFQFRSIQDLLSSIPVLPEITETLSGSFKVRKHLTIRWSTVHQLQLWFQHGNQSNTHSHVKQCCRNTSLKRREKNKKNNIRVSGSKQNKMEQIHMKGDTCVTHNSLSFTSIRLFSIGLRLHFIAWLDVHINSTYRVRHTLPLQPLNSKKRMGRNSFSDHRQKVNHCYVTRVHALRLFIRDLVSFLVFWRSWGSKLINNVDVNLCIIIWINKKIPFTDNMGQRIRSIVCASYVCYVLAAKKTGSQLHVMHSFSPFLDSHDVFCIPKAFDQQSINFIHLSVCLFYIFSPSSPMQPLSMLRQFRCCLTSEP